MAVPCPGCGREYDVALFAFGRTLHCACGRRVALAPRAVVFDVAADGPPRFAADAMLGRLARWLRVLGFDTTWEADVDDAALVRHALDEERWILTRDRALPHEWSVPRVVQIAAEKPLEQLREVLDAFGLEAAPEPFGRCTRCNARVEVLPREAAAGRVPPRVLSAHERFFHCPGCGRVYWEGTHVARMRHTLERVLGRG